MEDKTKLPQIERQQNENENAQKPMIQKGATGFNINTPRMTSFALKSGTTTTVPRKPSRVYSTVYDAQTGRPVTKDQDNKSSASTPEGDSSTSSAVPATDAERQHLMNMMMKAAADAAAQTPSLITEQSGEANIISIPSGLSMEPIPVESDDEGDATPKIPPKSPPKSHTRLDMMLGIRLSYDDSEIRTTNQLITQAIREFTLSYLLTLDTQYLRKVRMWLSSTRVVLRTPWQKMIDFSIDFSTEIVTVTLYLTALADQSFQIEAMDPELVIFIGGFIHIHLEYIQEYLKQQDMDTFDNMFTQLLYSGSESKLKVPSILPKDRRFTQEDLRSLCSLETQPDLGQDVQKEIGLCKLMISSLAKLHTGQAAGFSMTSRSPSPKPKPHPRPATPVNLDAGTEGTKGAVSKKTPPRPRTPIEPSASTLPPVPQDKSRPQGGTPDMTTINIAERQEARRARTEQDRLIHAELENQQNRLAFDLMTATASRQRSIDIVDINEFVRRYGDECVDTVGTIDTKFVDASDDQPSTIIAALSKIVTSSFGNYSITNVELLQARVIGTLVSLPDESTPFKQLFCNTSYPVSVLKALALQPFTVMQGGSYSLDNEIQTPAFTVAGSNLTDVKSVTNGLQNAVGGMSKAMAEGICSVVNCSKQRYSNLSVFTRMWLLHNMLVACEELNTIPEFGDLNNEDIVRIEVNATPQNLPLALTRLQAAITDGWPVFDLSELNPNYIQCMRLVSAGPQAITMPADSPHELLGHCIVWEEKVKWGILYRTGHQPDIPQNIRVSSAMLLDFIHHVARIYNRDDDLVNGFIRASLLITCQIVAVKTKSGSKTSRIVNSMLEMYTTEMPQTKFDNIIWRLLGCIRSEPILPNVACEAKYLASQNAKYFGHLSTATAAVISLGYSHVFHNINITGSVLTAYSRNVAKAVATTLLADLTRCKSGQAIPLISRWACGYIPQISSMTFSPLALLSHNWSGSGLVAASTNPSHSWRVPWRCAIPYLTQPQSMLSYNLLLDSNWGLTLPGVKGEFAKETKKYGDTHHPYWSAAEGDSAYAIYSQQDISYMLIPYGALAINVIMQQSRRLITDPLLFISIKRTAAGSVTMGSFPAEWADFEYNIIHELNILKVGTLLNYDWGEEAVMSPVLIHAEQVQQITQILEVSTPTLFRRAGLVYAGVRTHTTTNTNVDDLRDFKRLNLHPIGATVPTPPENKAKADEEKTRALDVIPTTPKVDAEA